MRAQNLATWSLIAAAAALPACKWTEFDDLKDDAWVESSGKPDGIKSGDYGILVERGAKATGDGGRLVVIGTNTASYSEIAYTAEGDTSVPATKLDLELQYGLANISPQTSLLIADPESDNISLFVASDNGVAMLTGSQGTLKLYQFFSVNSPDAATYLTVASHAGVSLPIVAVGDTVYGGFLPALTTGMAQPACKLTDTTKIRALGAVRVGASDDLLAWDQSGKLNRYPGAVFDGCGAGTTAPKSVDTGIQPGAGSKILQIDGTHVVLASTGGALLEVQTDTMVVVGSGPTAAAGLTSAALLDTGTAKYVVAGEPTQGVGGQIELFELTAAGVGAKVDTLNDAQPESGQMYGRSVTVVPYNGHQVIAVGASNEVFTYYRANLGDGSPLYAETRQGR